MGGAFVFGWSRLLPLLRRQGDVPKGKRKFSEHRVLSRICGVWSCGRLAARGTRRGPVGLGVSRSLWRGRTDVYGPMLPDAALRNMPRMLRGCMPRMHACQGVVQVQDNEELHPLPPLGRHYSSTTVVHPPGAAIDAMVVRMEGGRDRRIFPAPRSCSAMVVRMGALQDPSPCGPSLGTAFDFGPSLGGATLDGI